MLKEKRDNFRKIILNFLPKTEIWACHPNYDKYLISNTGLIKSLSNGKLMKQPKNSNGYHFVTIIDRYNKRTFRPVHRLVMETFNNYVSHEEMYEVNHIDGNKLNNNINNLEWVTRKENLQHARVNKLFKGLRGDKNPNVKILEKDKEDLKQFKILGFTVKEIAKSYNVSITTIYNTFKNGGKECQG